MKIIQITDTHLFANDELEIYGVKSNIKFKEVLDKIIDEDSHDADMIFLTGDISQDETVESYKKMVDYLSKLNLPVYWIPGNHDDIIQVETVFKNVKNFNRETHVSLSDWHIVFLNTKKEGAIEGFLSQSELNMLHHQITSSLDKKIAIAMHHHPVPVGTPLLDNYILKNTEEFWNIVTGTQVELIICGHVHGDYQIKHNNVMIESSPATCLQFEKGTKDLKIDTKIGYKIFHFDRDGYKAMVKLW